MRTICASICHGIPSLRIGICHDTPIKFSGNCHDMRHFQISGGRSDDLKAKKFFPREITPLHPF